MISTTAMIATGKVLAFPGELHCCHDLADAAEIQRRFDPPQRQRILGGANEILVEDARNRSEIALDTPVVPPFVDDSPTICLREAHKPMIAADAVDGSIS